MVLTAPPSRSEIVQRARARRLDDGGDADVYYVTMTPNILSGLLFALLFVVVVAVGLGCMNDIEGGTVFVQKKPDVGREN